MDLAKKASSETDLEKHLTLHLYASLLCSPLDLQPVRTQIQKKIIQEKEYSIYAPPPIFPGYFIQRLPLARSGVSSGENCDQRHHYLPILLLTMLLA